VAKSITIGIVASALWLAAIAAHAAGLGRLTVLSPLGQPLLAEVEIVSLQPGEEDGLSARLAPAEAFNAAGIEISPALLGVRVDITRRNNRPVLRLTTKQPVSEPFLDMLVELQWPTGRLVREYTFLLDPPDYRGRSAAIAAAPPAPPPPAQPLTAPQAEPAPQSQAAPQPQAQPQAESQAQAIPVPVPAPAAPPEAAASAEQKPAAEEKPAGEEKPAAAIEEKPITPTPAEAKEPAKEEAPKEATANPATHEVKKGDTLGAIARANLAPGVTLNQMLIAIFRANQDAFIRGNVNLVRTGKILNIPSAETIAAVDRDEANQLVKEHHAQFMEYRSRLAAVPSSVQGGPEREAAGRIEPKPEATPPAAPSDQVRLSKADPAKPAAPAARAAREDDAAARERALQEAQSRTSDLEKNIADLQKLLDLKNQQLAELEKRAAGKPAAAAPAPAKPAAQAPQPPAAPTPPASSATPPGPSASAAQAPAPQAPGPVAQAPQAAPPTPAPRPAAPTPPAEKKAEAPKPRPKPAPPPPEPSLLDELLDNPLYLAALGGVVLLLVGYALWSWRKKKAAHAKFQDSVLGAAAAGGGAAALHEPTASTVVSQAPVSQAPAGMEPEEVDPIAEADVYMAYGRDAQAEEILKEALQKDSSRIAVHGKLLEIYANRKDAQTFEQTALKLKGLTKGAGPEWEKAAALGRSIDPQNSIYGDVAAAPAGAPAPAAAPMLDFDLGGSSQGGPAAPDISLDEAKEPTATSGVDIELGATNTLKIEKQTPDETLATETTKSAADGLDFDLDLGATEEKKGEAAPAAAEASGGGLDFNLDLDDKKGGAPQPPPQPVAAPPLDLGEISLDLGGPAEETVAAGEGGDPKWQEVATKLDLAKAYEEMGDKDGARELLNEVMKDGDTAQKGQAQQILTKLG
jgi:pilus assembly protein FimV